MESINPTETHRRTASRIIVHALMLIASLAPALIVGIHSLSRPYVLMGSDQDLLWASEALRLLRGVGPSYADHPGALWPIVYALNIKALSVVFPNQITDPLGAVLLWNQQSDRHGEDRKCTNLRINWIPCLRSQSASGHKTCFGSTPKRSPFLLLSHPQRSAIDPP